MGLGLSLIGVGFTLLAGAVTYMAWRNGKIIREHTGKILERMDEGFRLVALLILAETKEERKEIAKRILVEKS